MAICRRCLENKRYTLRFGNLERLADRHRRRCACVQGRAKAKNGAPLTPAKVRKILDRRPERGRLRGPGVPRTQRIGPLPNLAKAVKKV